MFFDWFMVHNNNIDCKINIGGIFAAMAEILDIRELELNDSHKEALDKYNELGPGEAFILLSVNEPKELLGQFQQKHYGEFEWWPLEIGADLCRVHIGKSITTKATESIVGYMQTDHARLDVIMARFKDSVKSGDWDEAFSHFKEFDHGLRRHIKVEEELLFPIFEDKTGMKDAGPTLVMRMEHEDIRETLTRTFCATKAGDESAVRESSDALVNYLLDHNMKEEHVLYPELDACVNETERIDAIKKAQTY